MYLPIKNLFCFLFIFALVTGVNAQEANSPWQTCANFINAKIQTQAPDNSGDIEVLQKFATLGALLEEIYFFEVIVEFDIQLDSEREYRYEKRFELDFRPRQTPKIPENFMAVFRQDALASFQNFIVREERWLQSFPNSQVEVEYRFIYRNAREKVKIRFEANNENQIWQVAKYKIDR